MAATRRIDHSLHNNIRLAFFLQMYVLIRTPSQTLGAIHMILASHKFLLVNSINTFSSYPVS